MILMSLFQVTSALLQQYQNTEAPAQKRIAAYLMLMRNPDVVKDVLKTLKDETDLQVKSFVVSHITNLLNTDDPNLHTYVSQGFISYYLILFYVIINFVMHKPACITTATRLRFF